MAIQPVPCACGGSGGGGEPGETCCAPSITATALCRQDCSVVLVVVRSGCVACEAAPTQPEVVGWADPATGVFTAGPPPADAAQCDGCGCVDTICVTRCDDTTGDGAADTTYSELWCVKQDGSTQLLLTYQDDPSTSYTPTAPVDCEFGSIECHTQVLCDDSGPFLRRYTFVNGQALYEDVALDGQTAHIVNGAVRSCAGDGSPDTPCEAQTTPAATLGLCLADGTPVAVLITRDCAGNLTQDGWLNLTTGAYTSGPPPAGAIACGDSRAFELAGLLCDIDPNSGDVLGLVLVEYEYNPDGSLASVRLVDPATGNTYTLKGVLRHCPGDTGGQPEQDLTVLCDVRPDGTRVSFVRDYRRDAASGEITGHTDYTLDGRPYTVTGRVGQCEGPPENRLDVETQLLCVRDRASREITGQVIAERVYNDQTGDLTEQRLTDLTGAPFTLPAGAELVKCPEPDRIVRTICLAKQGKADFRTNPGNAASGVDADWEWSTSPNGPWYPMYDVQPNAAWTVTDTDTTSPAHWVAPHRDRTVCPTAGETSPPVSGTWYTRARWTLPPDADPDTIRISASVLNADNWVEQWRLNDGAWQPVNSTGTIFRPPAYTIPASQVPGARAGENQVVVQVHEIGPPASCPSVNLSGMMLHVTATYEHEPVTWTQVLEDGRIYYLDENGQRQNAIPAGYRQVPCGGGDGSCCPETPCPAQNIVQVEKCDDTDGDGTADAWYVELLGVDCQGTPTSLGTYTCDLSAPYAPVSPVDCEAPDAVVERPFGVQAHRVQLNPGQSWDASRYGTLRAVQATAHGGTGQITTAEGTSTLFDGETAEWSITRDMDLRLIGPLAITAATGAVVVNWTEGVDL